MSQNQNEIIKSKKTYDKFIDIVNSVKNRDSISYSSLRKHACDFVVLGALLLSIPYLVSISHDFQQDRILDQTYQDLENGILRPGFAILMAYGSVILTKNESIKNLYPGNVLTLFSDLAEKANGLPFVVTFRQDDVGYVVMKVDKDKNMSLEGKFIHPTSGFEISTNNLSELQKIKDKENKLDILRLQTDDFYKKLNDQNPKPPK